MSVATDLQLGSGKLYISVCSSTASISTAAVNAVEGNLVGYIKGGATIEYTPTVYDVKDDLGYVNQHFITGESVIIKCGLLTWNKDVIQKLVNNETASTESNLTTILVGAKGMTKMDKYNVTFQAVPSNGEPASTGGTPVSHTRSFTIIGVSAKGLNLAYQPDKETVVDVEFRAIAADDGHLLRIEDSTPST